MSKSLNTSYIGKGQFREKSLDGILGEPSSPSILEKKAKRKSGVYDTVDKNTSAATIKVIAKSNMTDAQLEAERRRQEKIQANMEYNKQLHSAK